MSNQDFLRVPRDRPGYGNIPVLDVTGTRLLFRTGYRKANWYLKKGIAFLCSRVPLTLLLLFDDGWSGIGR